MPPSFPRALLPGLGVLVLVAFVAVAATGSTPSGSSEGREPSDWLLDTVFTLAVVALVPAAAILVYGLLQRDAIAREIASGRYRAARRRAFLVVLVLFTIAAYFRLRDWKPNRPLDEFGQPVIPGGRPPAPEEVGGDGTPYEPEFAWIPVLVLAAIAAVAAGAAFVARRRRVRGARREDVVADALASALDESLDDLRAEQDARRAVVAAYARLERVLAAHGLPKRPSETPDEVLARILPSLDLGRTSIARLTGLFTWAKFSHHDVDADMKEEAIAALAQARDELREREGRAETRSGQAVAADGAAP